MTNLHIQSVRSPFDDPRLASAAIAALSRADAIGLLSRQITCLDDNAMLGLETGMAEAGIGQALFSELHRLPCSNPARLSALLEKINEALDQSPGSCARVARVTPRPGPRIVGPALGISQSSARCYFLGSRSTPDTVAARLPLSAFVVGDLAARTTTSAFGAGSIVRASGWTAAHPPRRSASAGRPMTTIRRIFLPSVVRSGRSTSDSHHHFNLIYRSRR